jgi:hypothetical protein
MMSDSPLTLTVTLFTRGKGNKGSQAELSDIIGFQMQTLEISLSHVPWNTQKHEIMVGGAHPTN